MKNKVTYRPKTGRHAKSHNRVIIREYYQANPNATQLEASKALGLCTHTIGKHLKELAEEDE